MERRVKDPDDILDYGWNWTPWLGTDTIATSVWFAPAAVTVGVDAHTTTHTSVWLSGGTRKQEYVVTNRITTAGGRTQDWSFILEIRDR
jgi:hypothetical protein